MRDVFSGQKAISIEVTSETVKTIRAQLEQGRIFTVLLTGLSMVTAVFGVLAVMYTAVMGRRTEIGMLKAIGGSRLSLRAIFIGEERFRIARRETAFHLVAAVGEELYGAANGDTMHAPAKLWLVEDGFEDAAGGGWRGHGIAHAFHFHFGAGETGEVAEDAEGDGVIHGEIVAELSMIVKP